MNLSKYRKFSVQEINERETGKMGLALIIEDAHAYVPLYDADSVASIAKALNGYAARMQIANRHGVLAVAPSVLRNAESLEKAGYPKKFALNP